MPCVNQPDAGHASRPLHTIQTLRCGLINPAGLLAQPSGRRILDAASTPLVRQRFKTIESALAA